MLIAHYDQIDLDWEEVAERGLIDERRGLVIAQVAVLDDLIDEFILYLLDPPDPARYQRDHLDTITTGLRLGSFEQLLRDNQLLDNKASRTIADLRAIVATRNRLAHGTIYRRPTRVAPIRELATFTVDVEWVLVDRRRGDTERVSMAGLRRTLHEAQGCFMALLAFAETFVEAAPTPTHFPGGWYLGSPTA